MPALAFSPVLRDAASCYAGLLLLRNKGTGLNIALWMSLGKVLVMCLSCKKFMSNEIFHGCNSTDMKLKTACVNFLSCFTGRSLLLQESCYAGLLLLRNKGTGRNIVLWMSLDKVLVMHLPCKHFMSNEIFDGCNSTDMKLKTACVNFLSCFTGRSLWLHELCWAIFITQ